MKNYQFNPIFYKEVNFFISLQLLLSAHFWGKSLDHPLLLLTGWLIAPVTLIASLFTKTDKNTTTTTNHQTKSVLKFKESFYTSRDFFSYITTILIFYILTPPDNPIITIVMPFIYLIFFLLIFTEKRN